MNINLHLLLASGTLNTFKQDINFQFQQSIKIITTYIPAHDVDVVIYDNPEAVVPEQGIGGYTPNEHVIYISLDPTFSNLKASLKTQLKRTLAHELHHTLRWKNPGYGKTLLDAMITEGLADHFDIEVYHEKPQPWAIALSDEQLNHMIKKAEKEFHNTDYDHVAWFYGNEDSGIPRWAGYAIGFELVKRFLTKHPDKKTSQLYSAPTSDFVYRF